MDFQVGDIILQTVGNLKGLVVAAKSEHPASVKILWLGSLVDIEYPHTYFCYFKKYQ